MKMIIRVSLTLLFFSFALVQYNDADGWKWIVAYALPCVLFAAWIFEWHSAKAGRILLITFSCIALLYVPSFIDWATKGFPSIVESMQAKKPYVEFVREFFGLLIIILSLIYYLKTKPDDDGSSLSEPS